MCTLRFVWISEPMVVTLFVHLYLSDNCVINALPGYSMVFFWLKYTNEDDSIMSIVNPIEKHTTHVLTSRIYKVDYINRTGHVCVSSLSWLCRRP